MTKGELMTLIYGENHSGIDTALPQPHTDVITNELALLGLTFDPSLYCMNYNDDGHGKLVNLAEELVRSGKLDELLLELKNRRYADNLRNSKENKAYADALSRCPEGGP